MDEVKEMCELLLSLDIDSMSREQQSLTLFALGFNQVTGSTWRTHEFTGPGGYRISFDSKNLSGEVWDVEAINREWLPTFKQAYEKSWPPTAPKQLSPDHDP